MGLGKTLQTLAAVYMYRQAFEQYHARRPRVLVVCPTSVIQNWMTEVQHWFGAAMSGASEHALELMLPVEFTTQTKRRQAVVAEWSTAGLIMICGYELLRFSLGQSSSTDDAGVLGSDISSKLLDADLVILDEGHRIKSDKTQISQALSLMKTKSRIVLTGYPLQNSVSEYYAMVNWACPGLLGDQQRFRLHYEKPILQGQCIDSSPSSVRVAKQKMFRLHAKLKDVVLRRGTAVLEESLPRHEVVVWTRLSSLQRRIYRAFTEFRLRDRQDSDATRSGSSSGIDLLAAVHHLRLLYIHPLILYRDLAAKRAQVAAGQDFECTSGAHEWAWPHLCQMEEVRNPAQRSGVDHASPKLSVLMSLLDSFKKLGDKSVVFTQSMETLGFLEDLLQMRNFSVLRLDGSTPRDVRNQRIDAFNGGQADVFIVSTKAGGEGISMVGGNRVVILDVSWNPCTDGQAARRCYRYGQRKHVYIYRLVAAHSFEAIVFARQTQRESLGRRVVDATPVQRAFRQRDLASLFRHNPGAPGADPTVAPEFARGEAEKDSLSSKREVILLDSDDDQAYAEVDSADEDESLQVTPTCRAARVTREASEDAKVSSKREVILLDSDEDEAYAEVDSTEEDEKLQARVKTDHAGEYELQTSDATAVSMEQDGAQYPQSVPAIHTNAAKNVAPGVHDKHAVSMSSSSSSFAAAFPLTMDLSALMTARGSGSPRKGSGPADWACSSCTLVNAPSNLRCQACSARSPADTPPSMAVGSSSTHDAKECDTDKAFARVLADVGGSDIHSWRAYDLLLAADGEDWHFDDEKSRDRLLMPSPVRSRQPRMESQNRAHSISSKAAQKPTGSASGVNAAKGIRSAPVFRRRSTAPGRLIKPSGPLSAMGSICFLSRGITPAQYSLLSEKIAEHGGAVDAQISDRVSRVVSALSLSQMTELIWENCTSSHTLAVGLLNRLVTSPPQIRFHSLQWLFDINKSKTLPADGVHEPFTARAVVEELERSGRIRLNHLNASNRVQIIQHPVPNTHTPERRDAPSASSAGSVGYPRPQPLGAGCSLVELKANEREWDAWRAFQQHQGQAAVSSATDVFSHRSLQRNLSAPAAINAGPHQLPRVIRGDLGVRKRKILKSALAGPARSRSKYTIGD